MSPGSRACWESHTQRAVAHLVFQISLLQIECARLSVTCFSSVCLPALLIICFSLWCLFLCFDRLFSLPASISISLSLFCFLLFHPCFVSSPSISLAPYPWPKVEAGCHLVRQCWTGLLPEDLLEVHLQRWLDKEARHGQRRF